MRDQMHTLDPDFGSAGHPNVRHVTRDLRNIIDKWRPNLVYFEDVYRDLHQNPELSCKESRTASIVAEHLDDLHFITHRNIGGHGVVGVFQNGQGSSVLLRAELDALPILEETGVSYASHARMKGADGTDRPVMHACGHDIHVSCLMAVSTLLASARDEWSGTLICLFQPNEELAGGARSMVDDGLYEKIPLPDVLLAQHVSALKSGVVAIKPGTVLSAASTVNIRIYGRGGHGSEPQNCVDPVMLSAYILVRLQSIVSRETDPEEPVVITCGSIQGGDAGNVIPGHVDLKINVRTYSSKVLGNVLHRIKNIVEGECQTSNSPQKPLIVVVNQFPLTSNDEKLAEIIDNSFQNYFKSSLWGMTRKTASDDFPVLAEAAGAPYVYWTFGGTDPDKWNDANEADKLSELPGNHSSKFAPAIELTMRTGVDAFSLAALSFLTKQG